MGRRIPVVVRGHMQSPETNQSHEPVNPPVDKDARENNEHYGEKQCAENNPPGAESSEARPAEEQTQPKKTDSAQPEEQRRAKKRFGWIKRYRVPLVVISTVVSIVYGLTRLADLYISKRAYVEFGSDVDTKRAVSVLPGDEGIQIHLRNGGQTIIRKIIASVWILPEDFLLEMKGGPVVTFPVGVTLPGEPFSIVVEWSVGPEEIPRIQKGEVGVGFVARIDYQDAFFVWHCQAVSVDYTFSPPGGFIGREGIPVCDTRIQSIRYSRKCVVPFPGRVKGEWEGVWEWLPGPHRLGPPSKRNPVPCIRWSEKKS